MGLCNTVHAVPRQIENKRKTAKKTDLVSFRLSPAFQEAIDVLRAAHGAKNQSEYFRGLIYLDAIMASGIADLLDKPAWVTRDYGDLIRGAAARSSQRVSSETREQLQTALDIILREAPSEVIRSVSRILGDKAKRFAHRSDL